MQSVIPDREMQEIREVQLDLAIRELFERERRRFAPLRKSFEQLERMIGPATNPANT